MTDRPGAHSQSANRPIFSFLQPSASPPSRSTSRPLSHRARFALGMSSPATHRPSTIRGPRSSRRARSARRARCTRRRASRERARPNLIAEETQGPLEDADRDVTSAMFSRPRGAYNLTGRPAFKSATSLASSSGAPGCICLAMASAVFSSSSFHSRAITRSMSAMS